MSNRMVKSSLVEKTTPIGSTLISYELTDEAKRALTVGERAIDAHSVDLEQEMSPKKRRRKRKSSSTYNARTLGECRKRGWIAQGVEQTIKIPGGRTFKRDLFGVLDVVAVDLAAAPGQRTIGIQTTSGGTGGAHSPHRAKIISDPRALAWLQAGNRLELWSWAKQGARGKAKRWKLRVEVFTVEDWPPSIELEIRVPEDRDNFRIGMRPERSAR